MSTLDYAFRAKNIRNKPQINQMVPKKTLLREFTAEIERLKAELVAARQKNGVYLTPESYDELVGESESRRILTEEQNAKIEAMEKTLRDRGQELYSLTANFNSLKKEHDDTKMTLDETKGLLDSTRRTLAEESRLRQAHEDTEKQLYEIGEELQSTLGTTVTDVNRLRSKIQRTSALRMRNQSIWERSQHQVYDYTRNVKMRLDEFESQQKGQMIMLSAKVGNFVREQIQSLAEARGSLHDREQMFDQTNSQMSEQLAGSVDDMGQSLEVINVIRGNVKDGVGHALDQLSDAAAHISAEVAAELLKFNCQVTKSSLHSSQCPNTDSV